MGKNRHTEIKKNRILKTSMESYNNKRRKLLKKHFFMNLRKKNNFSTSSFCVIKHNMENIVEFL